jgi:hypothetical protein
MEKAKDVGESSFVTLWHRALVWRAVFVGASILTLASLMSLAAYVGKEQTVTQHAAGTATREILPPQETSQRAAATDVAFNLPQPDGAAASINQSTTASTVNEDEEVLATCHPHLLRAPPSMPQIDIAAMPQPNLGHLKMHLWVNGAGVVTRETILAATLGTPAEQQAEAAYIKELTFALPNTKECRTREVEVVGDFFEQRDPRGRWATYVRLYPRLSFNSAGALVRTD